MTRRSERLLFWFVATLVVLFVAGFGFGMYREATTLPGPGLSSQSRAEISAADCNGLRALAGRYGPNADSDREAHDAQKLIMKRLRAECLTP